MKLLSCSVGDLLYIKMMQKDQFQKWG